MALLKASVLLRCSINRCQQANFKLRGIEKSHFAALQRTQALVFRARYNNCWSATQACRQTEPGAAA
eukprot:3030-Heterococcus_DN1.PRE.3